MSKGAARVERREDRMAAKLAGHTKQVAAQVAQTEADGSEDTETMRAKLARLQAKCDEQTRRIEALESGDTPSATAKATRRGWVATGGGDMLVDLDNLPDGVAEDDVEAVDGETPRTKAAQREAETRQRGVAQLDDDEWEAHVAPMRAQAMANKREADRARRHKGGVAPGSRVHVPTLDELADRAANSKPGTVYDLAPCVEASGSYA